VKRAKKFFLVLDTETADLSGSVYDVGFTIVDKSGKIYAEFNALVREVFTDPGRMMGAFYAKKVFSHYAPMLDAGTIRLKPWAEIVGAIRAAVIDHDVSVIAAYNAGFDFRVMASTHKALGCEDRILPRALDTLDVWQFACETVLSQSAYKRLALERGWVSDAGNMRTGAEYAYRFCSGDWGFIESHTALDDARIEGDIMARCFDQHKKAPYGIINASPWRIPNGR
jgi:hypothetical protein